MTEFEAATLALQKWQMWAAIAIPLVGLVQAAVVTLGILQMRRAGDQRTAREDARHTEAMRAIDKRHAETMNAMDVRHTEAMNAMDVRHAEAMRAIDKRHTEAMAAQAATMRALEALIERTSKT